MSPRIEAIIKGLIPSIAIFLGGFLAAWQLYHCRTAPPEPPAAAIHQKDGSLILERSDSGKPAANPEAPVLKPAGTLPKGAVVERNIQIVVQPEPGTSFKPNPHQHDRDTTIELVSPGATDLSSAFQCPEVKVDLSLVKMQDQTQRVIASSPDGKVVGGLDVPIARQEFPKPIRWTAQAMAGYDVHQGRQVFGGQVSRNVGPFTVSVGVIGQTAFLGAGIHF
jgi:hypothetical protein